VTGWGDTRKGFPAMLLEAGFIEVELVKDTGFNSSPSPRVFFSGLKKTWSSVSQTEKVTVAKTYPNTS